MANHQKISFNKPYQNLKILKIFASRLGDVVQILNSLNCFTILDKSDL
jgi:hypothetical protein